PDVVHLEPVALEELRDRVDRADAHLVGLAARDGKTPVDAERLEAALLGDLAIHDAGGARPGEPRARFPRRDRPAVTHGLELPQPLDRRVRAVAFVLLEGDLFVG